MAASSSSEDVSGVEEKIADLSVQDADEDEIEAKKQQRDSCPAPHLSGFETSELYKLALRFYKDKEGKAVHLSYEDKLKLVAFTKQVSHGKYSPEKGSDLGVLDVIGRDRKLAWQSLGEMGRDEAMRGFILLLDELCPPFKTFVEAQKRDVEEKARLRREEERRLAEAAKKQREEEEERLRLEHQRRQVQDALNQQTYYQFRAYAEQQYPGNPEQQGVLVRQLQEQHYHQYMQQLQKSQSLVEEREVVKSGKRSKRKPATEDDPLLSKRTLAASLKTNHQRDNDNEEDDEKNENEEEDEAEPEANEGEAEEDSDEPQDIPKISPAEMWTNKTIVEFKETIRREAGDTVIKVGHGETVTVRVPTHKDGSYLFWEFATDGYDIGFGVYFEWTTPNTTQVSVHISESEDDDDDEEEEDYESREDLECGSSTDGKPDFKPSTVPISVIIPIYRRDSQEKVYAGSHKYPGQGIYLLKFDNSYSLWRSKTLYYRVYYTKADNKKD